MRINGAHIDQRRLLLPRDYVMAPPDFGVVADARFWVPDGGDPVSMLIAAGQHRLICAWFRLGQRPSAAALCEKFRISRAVWSRTVTGHRWAGETCLAALVHADRDLLA